MIIDQLPTISNVQNSDELPIERGQTTYKTTVGKVVGAVSKIVADEYDNTSTYAVGDYCVYEGTLYVCNTAISTAEEWNASHWTATNVTDEIPSAYTSNPAMDGTASPGSSTAWARGDHVHPADTNKQNKITASGILKGDGSGGVSAATKGTDFGGLAFTVTLTAAGWSNNAQTVSNSNFATSGYSYIVSPASGSFADYASAQIYADNVTAAGQMTFHCTTVPSSDLTVNILRGVSA